MKHKIFWTLNSNHKKNQIFFSDKNIFYSANNINVK